MFNIETEKRSFVMDRYEERFLDFLFNFYCKKNSPITIKLSDESKHILIVKFYQLVYNVGGLSSKTKDNLHVGFIDVDDYDFEKLKNNLKRVQEEFDLSTWYVLKSSETSFNKNNYHCICLDKHTFGFWIDVLKSFDNEATLQYQRFAINRDHYVLRISDKGNKPKPELIYEVKRFTNHVKSWSHWYFLKLRYDISDINVSDSLIDLEIENYETIKK